MRQIFFILAIILHRGTMADAQQVTFSKVFSNYPLNPENGVIIEEVLDGFLILSFSGCTDNIDNNCTALTKMSNEGDLIWFKQYPFRHGSATLQTLNDKIYIAGHIENTDNQYTLYCLDSEGNTIWNKEYGKPGKRETFPRLSLYGDKLLLCGSQDRDINNRPAPIVYFVVTDLEGNQLQEFYYGDQNESTLPKEITKDTWGNLMISFTYCPDICFLDLKAGVLRIDSLGNVSEWLDLPYSYQPTRCLATQIDSNTIATKWHIDSSLPNHDLTPPALFFTDMQGNINDTLIFENQSLKDVINMEAIFDHGLVGCGDNYIDFFILPFPPLAGWVFRMDEHRQILWDRTYTDTTYSGECFGFKKIIPTKDGGYITVGTISNFMTGVWESHNWILKLDSLGCLEPNCSGTNYVSKTEEAVFLKGQDIKIYPNPASEYVQVEFPSDFSLKDAILYLVSNEGKTIKKTAINSNIQTLFLSDVISGMYYAIITRGNEVIASKRVIVHH